MSTLTLSQLPDVCLLAIFDRLPLRDLAIIGDVSEHWATLQHTIFTRRGILTLLIGSQPYNLVNSSYFSYPLNNSMTVALHGTSKSSAELPKLDESTVKTLIEQYPHRARLEIAINNLDSSSVTTHLISLLEASSSTLISLKLWLRFALPDRLSLTAKNLISSDLFRLLSVINSLPHLTCLTLDIHNQFTLGIESAEGEDDNLDVQIELPILAQLKQEFYFYSLNGADSLADSLKRYGQSNKSLEAIGLRNSVYSAECLCTYFEMDAKLLRKFTHLNTHQIARYHLDEFATKFTSLVTLSTTVVQATLPLLFRSLAKLSTLVDLRLYIYFEVDSTRTGNSSATDQPLEVSTAPSQLPTIKSLSLYGGISAHSQMLVLCPGQSFPNLTEVRIALSLYGCPDCGYESINTISAEQREECYRLMAKPWIEQCRSLKEAYIFNVQIPLDNGLTRSQVFMINNG